VTKPKSIWRPLRPIPDDAPPPPSAHYARGKPLAAHLYRDETGALMGTPAAMRAIVEPQVAAMEEDPLLLRISVTVRMV
jgi:hypothetical protein